MALTRLGDMFSVEVFADSISARLGDAIKLTPFAFQQSFEGQQAGQITLPKFAYIGDGVILPEGEAIEPSLLTRGTETLDVIKMAKAVNITAEAISGSYGNPLQEAEDQLVASIASGIEREMFARLATAPLTYTAESIGSEAVIGATALFGEDQDGAKALVINPVNLPQIRMDDNFVNNQLFDLDVVVSNRVPEGNAYILKPDGLGLYMAKSATVLVDEDVLNFSTVLSAYSLFATHVRDESKVIRIGLGA